MKEPFSTSIKYPLNSKTWQKTRFAGRFVRFIFSSGTRHQVHSPFLYDFINEVIRSKQRIENEDKIEALRKSLLKSRTIINKKDFGTGSEKPGNMTYPAEIRKIARRSLNPAKYARRLSLLVKYLRAEKVLELGTSLGITTSYLASGNPLCKITTLEGCPETSMNAIANFRELKLGNIKLITGRFEDTLPVALEELGSVDIVFIDGNHRKEAVLDYFVKCVEYSNNNTVIIVDDIHLSEGMEEAWEEIKRHDMARVSLDLFYSGWIIMRKELSRQHFRLKYF
jgi:predicted O-methyltransferase YrrM